MERLPQLKRGEEAQIHLHLGRSAVPLRSHLGETYLSLPTSPTGQTVLPLRSRRAELWITANFYRVYECAPSPHAIKRALSVLEARALFDAVPQAVGRRLLAKTNTIILDRANGDLPHAFERDDASGQLPIPEETIDQPLTHFRQLLAIHYDESWANTLTWLTAALRPNSPCPILVIDGPAGSGKSTIAKMLKGIIDPSPATEGHIRIVDAPIRIPRDLAATSETSPPS